MATSKKAKVYLILAPIALVLLFVAYKAAQYWYYRGYSLGERTGIVRKVSIKGPPYCKYLEGEMVLQGNNAATVTQETWTFSVDDADDKNPIVVALHEAEKNGTRVTLHYRQDLHSLYRCTPSEYFVTKVDK